MHRLFLSTCKYMTGCKCEGVSVCVCVGGGGGGGGGGGEGTSPQSHAGHIPVTCRSYHSHMRNIPRWMVKLSSSGGGVASAEKSSGG